MGKRTGRGRNPEPISHKAAADLDIVSFVDGPLSKRDELARSLLFAELSMLSYLHDAEAQPVLADVGFEDVRYIERDGAQAYELMNAHDVVVVCRGTEPNEWNDIKADANALTDLAETIGRVHRGFKREVDDIWPELEDTLADERRDVWFTGHSLGGAMATICAGRCQLSDIAAVPVEVVTFGSPRVGTKRYVQHADVTHIRWVNNNDIVTRVPPTWLRYRHTGERRYLDRNGDIRRMTAQQRAKDRWAGFVDGIKQRRFDHFSDHSIADYVEYLTRAVGDR
ncbi:MAG: lipase family protein [Acidimicrobiia bacterium]|nr:lipase family protein [Acidimicrobiia bacterium]